MTTTQPATAAVPVEGAAPPVFSPADRFMRRLLRISGTEPVSIMGAHRAFRRSLVISGIRCLITYLVVPILVPILSFAGVIAAPLGIALCLFAVVNGVISVRRFWAANHSGKWMYTIFMAVVFVVLGIALAADISRLASLL